MGEEDYELDDDLVNMLLAEHRSAPLDNQTSKVFVLNFMGAHLTTLYNGRRFTTDEYQILHEIMQDGGDDIILASYECYCLNRNEGDLVETLCLLAKLELLDMELDCDSPIQESFHVEQEESKRSDYQRDSWPHGFQTMVDRSKASKILEEFKPLMSSVKYTILYGVVSPHAANRARRALLHRPHPVLLARAERF